MISAGEQLQTYALERAATGTGNYVIIFLKYCELAKYKPFTEQATVQVLLRWSQNYPY
jgi:hypothetical protein